MGKKMTREGISLAANDYIDQVLRMLAGYAPRGWAELEYIMLSTIRTDRTRLFVNYKGKDAERISPPLAVMAGDARSTKNHVPSGRRHMVHGRTHDSPIPCI